MKRRHFLFGLGAFGLSFGGLRYWPDEGIWNPCAAGGLPEALARHELVSKIWEGLDTRQLWDCHTHLIGKGDSDSGIWVNPNMDSLLHPIQYVQFQFYLNAACAAGAASVDEGYVNRLMALNQDLAPGSKLMLLAFDYHHDENGERITEVSPFYTPNEYAARLARQHPEHFEWIASIHPYRRNCVEALEWAAANGARAVKWLPGAMRIDPSSALCDRFYDAALRLKIPLLVHSGSEHAVHVEGLQQLGNPLLLRRPLDRGVKIILAHCASLGSSPDIDQGPDGPEIPNFELFTRLMDEAQYRNNLFGDISAVTQVNRDAAIIAEIIRRQDWHPRLLQGSDYPLPGVMPVFSLDMFVGPGYLQQQEADFLSQVRVYNPLLFDIGLKRLLQADGLRLGNTVFETRRMFAAAGSV
ncbi:MAG: hypothetical protein A2V90_02565 [Gammaproteobacteria bacterium RBG_16_57_12]|nr:MAG: hypothetical protein A2V90_02565 [Gammaproteobacteria bacterium RBG_16_57_12]